MRRTVLLLPAALLLTSCGSGAGAVASSSAPSSSGVARTQDAGFLMTRDCGEQGRDSGPVDLQQVSLRSLGSRLTATFRLGGPPAAVPGVLQLSVGIWSGDGAAQRSLDVRWVDGSPMVRMYDVMDAQDRQLAVHPDVSGGTVTVQFPASATEGLGRSWRWEAFAIVDGTDVDECPAG